MRFLCLDTLFVWQVLLFGLKCRPRMLTKVLKPVVAFFRVTWGFLIAIYLDGILIQGSFPFTSVFACASDCFIVHLAVLWILSL